MTVQANQGHHYSGRGHHLSKKGLAGVSTPGGGQISGQLSTRAVGTVQTRYRGLGTRGKEVAGFYSVRHYLYDLHLVVPGLAVCVCEFKCL